MSFLEQYDSTALLRQVPLADPPSYHFSMSQHQSQNQTP